MEIELRWTLDNLQEILRRRKLWAEIKYDYAGDAFNCDVFDFDGVGGGANGLTLVDAVREAILRYEMRRVAYDRAREG